MNKILLIITLFFCIYSCEKETITPEPISIEDVKEGIKGGFYFDTVYVVGDSIHIVVNYGGGCGTISGELQDQGSSDCQHNFKFIFTDNDYCKAAIQETFKFDLTPMKVCDTNTLNLYDYGKIQF